MQLQTVVLSLVPDDENRVLMLWRHRFATDEWGWELPGGILDQGEDPAVAAVREVEEETGWRPLNVEHLVSLQPMPGIVDTAHQVYVGRSAVKVGEPTDLEEAGRVDWVPLQSAPLREVERSCASDRPPRRSPARTRAAPGHTATFTAVPSGSTLFGAVQSDLLLPICSLCARLRQVMIIRTMH